MEHRNNLNVKGHEFDTNQGYPDFESDLMIDGYEEGEEGIYIVDMVAPSNPEWREELENIGIEILNYQPNYAYEVVMTPRQAKQIEEKFFVDWVGIYQPGFKLAEDLKPGEVNIRLIEEPSERTIKDLERRIDIQSVTELNTRGFNVNFFYPRFSLKLEPGKKYIFTGRIFTPIFRSLFLPIRKRVQFIAPFPAEKLLQHLF